MTIFEFSNFWDFFVVVLMNFGELKPFLSGFARFYWILMIFSRNLDYNKEKFLRPSTLLAGSGRGVM